MRAISIAFIVFLLLLFSHPALSQTTVVALENKDELVVAADSRLRIINLDGTPGRFENTCKINKFGRDYFTFAGPRWIYSVDIDQIAGDIFTEQGSTLDKINRLDQWILKHYPVLLESVHTDNPSAYEDTFEGKVILSYMVFGLDRGEPYLYVRAFQVVREERISVHPTTILNCPYSACVDKESAPLRIAMGETAAIEASGRTSKGADLVKWARKYVQMEIKDKPLKVGAPIDIIRLGKDGERWIHRKPQCNKAKI